MDMPPPQNITPVEQVNIINYNSRTLDEIESYYYLSLTDTYNIPQNVKQFAKNNNCRYLKKEDYWSYKKYENKGGVYFCSKNKKEKYIFDNGKKLRFANRIETYQICYKRMSKRYRILYLLFGL